MDTRKRGSTSEMQVTSIRLEPELKDRLREISGEQGYQTLIREVLWQFVEQQMRADEVRPYWHRSEIRVKIYHIGIKALLDRVCGDQNASIDCLLGGQSFGYL